jgi:non-ribosomal peptide synthetase component F
MVCGLFGIMCAGGVYCPLNPTDPSERLVAILEQLQGHYVLIHAKTRNKFPSTTTIRQFILLEEILSPLSTVENRDDLLDCRGCGVAVIVCTSGTTGRHKAVVHTFKSISAFILAFIQWDVDLSTTQDQALQVAACSWLLHVPEIMVPLAVGGTLVLLRPGGHLDMAYFSQTLIQQQVTTVKIGPAIIRALTNYLEITQRLEIFKFVRNVITTGDSEILSCS